MKTFELPDGRILNIPADPNQRQIVADAINQVYGAKYPNVAQEYMEGTTGGAFVEGVKNFPRMAATSTISGIRGLFDLAAQDSLGLDGPFVQARDKLKQVEENIYANVGGAQDPRYSDDFISQAGGALGSIVPYAALGRFGASRPGAFAPYAAPGSTGIRKLIPSKDFLKTPTFQYPAALGIGQSISDVSDKMRIAEDVYGEDIGLVQETLGTLTGGLIGSSEALPIFNFFKNIPKSALRDATTSQKIANYARTFGTGAVQEGLQEATAGLARDLTAKGFFSNELPIGDSVWDDLTLGGFAGGVLNTVMNYAAGRRGIASEYRAEKEKRAEKNKQDALRTKKFDIAKQSGNIDIIDPTLEGEQLEETLLLPYLSGIPEPVEITTKPQLQIINNPDNTFTLRDLSAVGRNNIGEVETFNKESDALVAKQNILDKFDIDNQTQIINNDLYALGLNNSSTGFTIGQTLKDANTTTVDLKEIVTNDSSLKDAQAMQNVLMGKNKKYKSLPIQENYTFAETKKILSKKDFDTFASETAKQVAKVAEDNGYKPVIDKTKPNVTIKKLKEVAESKNINLDVNSPAFQYAAQMYTGTNKFQAMSKGQKELLLARLQSLPRFNQKLKFPDFRPRDYSAEDVSEFVSNIKTNNMTFNKKSLKQVGKDEQFLDDLIYSGRAEKIGTSQNYKIRDNFEQDIAARTEGFDENIAEFNNRLNTDSVLPPEEVAKLTEEETITQSKPLPPEEQNKQTINFAEAVQEGKLNKFAKELKNRLNKLGLKETGVVVSNDVLSSTTLVEQQDGSIAYDPTRAPAEGEYDRNTDIIFLSLNNINPNGKATDAEIQQRLNAVLDHELIHALREKDLINEKEYDYLRKQAKKIRVPKAFDAESFAKKETFYQRAERINKVTFEERASRGIIDNTLAKNELYAEEAIAEMYRARGFRSPLPPRAEGIYNKIVEFFKELGNSALISGYSNTNEIFTEIEAGKIGARERGKIRTTKLLDRGPSPFVIDQELEDTPTFARGPRDESSGHVADYVPAQYGPPAHALNLIQASDAAPEGFNVVSYQFTYPYRGQDIQSARQEFMQYSTARTPQEQQEEREFINKLMEIKGNPNAIITMYQAAPSRDLREGDIITPFLSDAQYYVDESKVTPEEVRAADRARRRQEQIDKTGAVDLNQERLFNQMDSIMDVLGTPQTTPSTIHTYELRAADVRWDGNNGWARWGYFPRIKAVEDVPTFSRTEEPIGKFTTRKDEYIEGNINVGKILGYDVEIYRDTGGLSGENYSMIITDPRVDMDIDLKSIGLYSKNLQEAKEDAVDKIQELINDGDIVDPTSVYFTRGIGPREVLAKLKPIDDIPTFSREADQAYFDREKKNRRISNLESSIYSKEAQLNQERGSMTDATARRLEREIQQQKNEIAELRAGDIPTFSRASTATEPAYMDLTRADVSQFTSFDEYRNIQGEKIPNAFVMRMPIDAYLKLTTPNQDSINKIKNEVIKGYPKGYQFGKFDPSQVDDQRYPIYLDINSIGKVISHEGRHRAALLQLEDAQTIPVVIRLKEEPIFDDKPMSSIKSINDLGIFTLGNQYKGSKLEEDYIKKNLPVVTDYSFDLTGQDIAMVRRFVKEDIDNAVRIANAPDIQTDIPIFSRGRRDDTGTNTQENIQLREAVKEAEELAENTARGGIPTYNTNASDTALKAALDFNKDLSSKDPGDIPTFSRPGFDGVDASIVEGINRTGSRTNPKNSMGYRFIDEVKDNISPRLKYFFNNFRTQFVDKLDKIDQLIIKASEENEQVRRANNTADTATIAALRMADRARGLFQGMLTKGYIDSVIEGVPALSNTKALKISTRYNQFLEGNVNTGGLMQILAPLYDSQVDKESIFKYYAMAKRTQGFDKRGRVVKSPIKEKDIQNIKKIEQQYPEVVEAYNNYQLWNNKLIEFATKKGILSNTRSTNELAEDISKITKEDVKELEKLSYDDLMNRVLEINKKLPLQQKIETRGTAQIWQENSDYYPFYKKMSDESTAGPRIASGALPNNPLDIKLTGSEEAVDVDVIEAISRNSLSILTAALKNDGVSKLIRDLQSLDMAKPITPEQAGKADSIFVFENGIKKHYQVESIETFEALTAIGGTPTGFWTTLVGAPAGLLRDTVTRDPGFVAINILRDTMSTMVTSGANYTPVIDSVKNMFADMHELERFGVLGGYDFANDEGSVKRYLKRTMRQQGMTEQNGMSASGAFFKLWDGLGALTTKSDGATRLAVYNAVYDKLISEGATQAQAQSEAAYQALEVINFGRRGLNPGFRFITAAIPFLNARVQGLDVLWRSSTGRYSAVEKLSDNQTLKDVQRKIQTNMLTNASILMGITLAYYLMYHDDEEYKNLKREVRDDNWVFPISKDLAFKVPIPFEVGLLFKVVPERVFDMTLGDDRFTKKSLNEAKESITRGAQTSLNIPFFQPGGGFQILKPISEAINNKNTFTGTEIVPYYQQKKEPGLQSRPTTNYLIKSIGEFLNISPSKMEHVVRGYTGSLGAHVLNVVDMTARGVTGEPILPSNVSLNKIPLINRLLTDIDKSGGYQQQFYELRNEVDRAVQTMNALEKAGRYDELLAYRSNIRGLLDIKNEARRIDRYLTKWRLRRDAIMNNPNMSVSAKSDAIRELELERDKRLAFVPEMRKRADIPFINMNIF